MQKLALYSAIGFAAASAAALAMLRGTAYLLPTTIICCLNAIGLALASYSCTRRRLRGKT